MGYFWNLFVIISILCSLVKCNLFCFVLILPAAYCCTKSKRNGLWVLTRCASHCCCLFHTHGEGIHLFVWHCLFVAFGWLFMMLSILSEHPSAIAGWSIYMFFFFTLFVFMNFAFCRYYSMYGHVAKLAEEIEKGASSVEGVEVKLWQVVPWKWFCALPRVMITRMFCLTCW